MENMLTCCVTGHRDIPQEKLAFVETALRNEIQNALDDGYKHFISGYAKGVDLIFTRIISEFKNEYLITLEAAIPYRNRLKTPDTEFQKLIKCCDILKIHTEKYTNGCFMVRNRYMVDNSERIIAVYDGRSYGGTAATMNYARQLNRELIEIKL